jgi:hypothetical protein
MPVRDTPPATPAATLIVALGRKQSDDSFVFSQDSATWRSVMRLDSGCLDSCAAKFIMSATN